MRRLLALSTLLAAASTASAQQPYENPKYPQADKFRQLDELLPTPNVYRTASGAPGPEYWQQQADYVIEVELDDVNQRLTGYETITYTNNSPDTLNYLWVQLDQNRFRPDSDDMLTRTTGGLDRLSFSQLDSMLYRMGFEGGYDISEVSYANGRPLKHTIVRTMMRVEPDKALEPGDTFSFNIGWSNNIIDADRVRSRGGYEYFPEDDNYIYEIAQWFPRMAAYTDYAGWQHKQFLGNGEFTLEFGDYDVSITAPDDHVVASTGVLQNPRDVMTREQRQRFERAKNATEPVFIVTPDEAVANQQGAPAGTKTWRFVAEDVRDFAWASSRKFIWDALGHDVNGNETMAMSFYPIEGEPLWSRYSTHTIVHTLNVYSRYSFDYPYPVAISVNGPVGGMEYPMICFNGPRPETDGTYTQRTKYGLIGVIIHEVGHFYFPMIVNSDERQWTWMDEGVNTFLQFLTEQEWEDNYPSRRGEPQDITGYMASQRQVPIMTNSESIQQFGANAYAKPATALNILRESVMGREAFDYAFKTYAERWKFKRPEPADLFRTMEDASGVDLDWFWRAWFYTTDHSDLAILGATRYTIDTRDPNVEKGRRRAERD
ncbi:MAG: M1 family metallopeptidase, partial [Planctomycetota bacterium]